MGHEADVREVEPAGRYVRGHEDREGPAPEVLDHLRARRARDVPVKHAAARAQGRVGGDQPGFLAVRAEHLPTAQTPI